MAEEAVKESVTPADIANLLWEMANDPQVDALVRVKALGLLMDLARD